MIKLDIFLHELTNKYKSKTLIVQKIKVKAYSSSLYEPLKYVQILFSRGRAL